MFIAVAMADIRLSVTVVAASVQIISLYIDFSTHNLSLQKNANTRF